MKRFILMLALLATMTTSYFVSARNPFAKVSKVEVVNDQTVIFRNVIKIEIITNSADQITYVYDLDHSKPVKAARGSFNVDLPMGDYLVLSNRKITKTDYKTIVENY